MIETILESIKAQNPYTPVCLMATVTYGTPYYDQLNPIRKFRDSLNRYWLGRKMVGLYYAGGTRIAQWLERHGKIRKVVLYIIVKPIVWLFNR